MPRKLVLTARDWRLIQRALTSQRDALAVAVDERRARGKSADYEEAAIVRYNEILQKLRSRSAV